MSNSSLFSYTTVCSSFTSIEPLFFELSCTQPWRQTYRTEDIQTDRQTDTRNDEYSIVAVDKPKNREHLNYVEIIIGKCRKSGSLFQPYMIAVSDP